MARDPGSTCSRCGERHAEAPRYVEVEPTDHPLAIEQRNGITPARVRGIAEAVLHPAGGAGRAR